LHVRVKAQHEVRRKMMLKDRQTTSPSAFCRMKDASSRGVEEPPSLIWGIPPIWAIGYLPACSNHGLGFLAITAPRICLFNPTF